MWSEMFGVIVKPSVKERVLVSDVDADIEVHAVVEISRMDY